jgi:asparagine synthetase B (glutamine-hydrolysing)
MEYALPFAGRAAAAQGVDVRFPLLDRRLLEFSAGTPDTMGLRDGWTRWLLRESIAGLVPDQIRWRVPKQDLTPGFVRGLLSHDREMVAEFGGTQRGDEEHLAERLQRLSDEAVTDPDEFYAVFQGTSLAAWRARVEAIRNQSAVDVSGGGSRNRRAVSIIRPPRRRSHRPPTTLRDRSWHRYERSSRITESPAAVTPFLVHARS